MARTVSEKVAFSFLAAEIMGVQRWVSQVTTIWFVRLLISPSSWMGLGLSFALAFVITQGIKNLIGKPRPDLLSRCQPDLSNIAAHVVGGYGQDISPSWTLVSSSICTQTDSYTLNDGFRSFLSGHSSMAWSGLLYLSLWLSSKLNLSIPYFHPRSMIEEKKAAEAEADESNRLPMHNEEDVPTTPTPPYERAAAPPLFGIVLFVIPISVAFWVSSTRYVDFKHGGIDIVSGSFLGIVTAWLGFRLYHGSLTRGESWAWSPRSVDKAFAVSSGHEGWVGSRTSMTKRQSTVRQEQRVAFAGSTPTIDK